MPFNNVCIVFEQDHGEEMPRRLAGAHLWTCSDSLPHSALTGET